MCVSTCFYCNQQALLLLLLLHCWRLLAGIDGLPLPYLDAW
jgi:hypothetical protein